MSVAWARAGSGQECSVVGTCQSYDGAAAGRRERMSKTQEVRVHGVWALV